MKQKFLAIVSALVIIMSLSLMMTSCELVDSLLKKESISGTYSMTQVKIETSHWAFTYDGEESEEEFDPKFLEGYPEDYRTLYGLSLAITYMVHGDTIITIADGELTYKNTYDNESITSLFTDTELSAKFSENGGILIFTGANADKLNELGLFRFEDGNVLLVCEYEYEGWFESEYDGEPFTMTIVFAKSNP
ncbi:MAG: hypothetical protein FWD30_03530 [Dehalococcoidia bacterium]|nr:hypothetical protein [Dehalococcoidia bacterium]